MIAYKPALPSSSSAGASLAEQLNNIYPRFEAIGSQQAKTAEAKVNGWAGAPLTPL